jgi:hypothetical protein
MMRDTKIFPVEWFQSFSGAASISSELELSRTKFQELFRSFGRGETTDREKSA